MAGALFSFRERNILGPFRILEITTRIEKSVMERIDGEREGGYGCSGATCRKTLQRMRPFMAGSALPKMRNARHNRPFAGDLKPSEVFWGDAKGSTSNSDASHQIYLNSVESFGARSYIRVLAGPHLPLLAADAPQQFSNVEFALLLAMDRSACHRADGKNKNLEWKIKGMFTT